MPGSQLLSKRVVITSASVRACNHCCTWSPRNCRFATPARLTPTTYFETPRLEWRHRRAATLDAQTNSLDVLREHAIADYTHPATATVKSGRGPLATDNLQPQQNPTEPMSSSGAPTIPSSPALCNQICAESAPRVEERNVFFIAEKVVKGIVAGSPKHRCELIITRIHGRVFTTAMANAIT